MNKTVLVVDDNVDVCELFSVAFASAGFEVLTAENGRKAIDILNSHDINVMTLDHDMPGMSGVEVLQELHTTGHLDSTKVAMVTANDSINYDSTVMALADLVLLKPVSFSQLIQLANRLVMQARV